MAPMGQGSLGNRAMFLGLGSQMQRQPSSFQIIHNRRQELGEQLFKCLSVEDHLDMINLS